MTIHLNGQPVAAAAGEPCSTCSMPWACAGSRATTMARPAAPSAAWAYATAAWSPSTAGPSAAPARPSSGRACGWKPKATASTRRNGHEPAPGDRRRRLGRHGRSHRAGQARGPLRPLRRGLASRRGGLSRPAGRRRSGLPRRALHPDAGKTAARFLRLRRAHRPAPEQPRGRWRRPAPDGPRRGGTAARGGVFAPAPGHRLP